MSWLAMIDAAQRGRVAAAPRATGGFIGVAAAELSRMARAMPAIAHVAPAACPGAHLGVYEGTAPQYGYGYGAAPFVDPWLPGRAYMAAPYDPQMFGRDSHAELEGYHLGSFTDTINSIIGGISSAATNVENIARGISTGAAATQYVAGRATQGGGALFQPSPADLAAKQVDVATLLGGNTLNGALIVGGLLLVFALSRKH